MLFAGLAVADEIPNPRIDNPLIDIRKTAIPFERSGIAAQVTR